jgi:uncharacterized protein
MQFPDSISLSKIGKYMTKKLVSLVTGASNGIGLEIARNLAAEGRTLVVVARSAQKLESLATEIRERYARECIVIQADLSASEGADAVVSALKQQNLAVDVLVNCAGFGIFGKHVDTKLADEQQMIDLNITTLTRLTKLLLPAMVARGSGRILNVASTAAFQPGPYMAVYYATKAYVLSYSEAIGEELRGTGVSVTALCPGPTASGFQDKADMHDSALVKGKRLPSTKDVADYAVKAMHRGQRVAIHGGMNWLMAQSLRLTPRAVATRFVAAMSKPV